MSATVVAGVMENKMGHPMVTFWENCGPLCNPVLLAAISRNWREGDNKYSAILLRLARRRILCSRWYRKRNNTEEKAKVVATAWGTD